MVLLAGCGRSATEQLVDARPTAVSSAAPTATPHATADIPAQPTVAPTAVPTATPTVTPAPVADAVVTASGFAQDKQHVSFGIVVDNPNPAAALERVELQIVAYGADDVILNTDEEAIPVLPPAVQTYVGGDMYLDTEQVVERIEVQITRSGTPQPATPAELPPFPVGVLSYRETSFSQQVSGVIENPFTLPLRIYM
jgi:hypothetical protein